MMPELLYLHSFTEGGGLDHCRLYLVVQISSQEAERCDPHRSPKAGRETFLLGLKECETDGGDRDAGIYCLPELPPPSARPSLHTWL